MTVQLLLGANDRDPVPGLGSLIDSVPRGCLEVIVGDLGMGPRMLRLLRGVGARVVPVSAAEGLDACRNRLLDESRTEWQFLLEAGEQVVGGAIADRLSSGVESAWTFGVLRGGILSREVRMWRNHRFTSPIFERVDAKGAPSGGAILGVPGRDQERDLVLADAWAERCPAHPDPYYYRSCLFLSLRRYEEFLRDVRTYLFTESDPRAGMTVAMARYYLACVLCYVHGDAAGATQQVAACILARPLMAEFWCLLGDIHYSILGRYRKALEFYTNALVLGSRRPSDDPYPMEVAKYREYPETMIGSCRRLMGQ